MMRLLLLTLLFSMKAMALNDTMLNMPPNNAYMKFAITKYLSWHRKQFKFPEDSELINSLSEKLDHWIVSGTPYYQITLTHGVDDHKKYFMKIRLHIAPELRGRKDFKGPGLPPAKELLFYEKDNAGKVCLILRESPTMNSAWCRKNPADKYLPEWTEDVSDQIPDGWPFPFPFLNTTVIRKINTTGVFEINFFKVGAHPSRMPEALYAPVYHNTKDPLFPLDRLSSSIGGGMSVHYP